MQTVTLAEAQERLKELVCGIAPASELLITEGDTPVARLSAVAESTSLRNLTPTSVGAVLRPFPNPEDDPLGEMLDAR